jgi:hypothetical protein
MTGIVIGDTAYIDCKTNLGGEAPLVMSRKRRRNPKDAESEVEDGTNTGTKRKKHCSPEITVEEDSIKPVGKRSRKVAKTTPKKGRQNPKDAESEVGIGTKRKKHCSPEISDEEDSIKPVGKKLRKVAKTTQKKGRRNPKDAESEVEDGTDTGTKRKKHSSPEITVKEDGIKPFGKRSREVAKTTRQGKKQSSDNSTTTSYVKGVRRFIKILNKIFSRKRKENAPVSKPSKKVS